jgi:hypothetical protein
MARAEVSCARLAVAISIATLICSCNQNDHQRDRARRISGTVDQRYFVHPTVTGAKRMIVKGCCTFDVGTAEVKQLTGDVDGREVRGEDYRLEITFGFRLGPLPASFQRSTQRTIDGVNVVELRAPPNQFAVEATVPLSNEAAQHGIDFPELQAVGRCDTRRGCDQLQRTLASVRF